jgi:hypothetical protein
MDFPSESTKARAMHTIRFLALQLLEHAAGSPLNQGANLKGGTMVQGQASQPKSTASPLPITPIGGPDCAVTRNLSLILNARYPKSRLLVTIHFRE